MPVINTIAPRCGALRSRSVASAALLSAALLGAPLAVTHAAGGKRMTTQEVQDYSQATGDPARAGWAIARLRNFLASDPDSAYAFFARRMLMRALGTTHAPVRQLVAAAETTSSLLPADPRITIFFYGELAQTLLDRGEALDRALEFARYSHADVPRGEQYGQLRAATLGTLGQAQLRNGLADSAIAAFRMALPLSPDSQAVLFHLGEALEQQKKADLAIDAYARSLGVYLSRDSSAAKPLRVLWRKRYGSLKGMDARIDAARAASRRLIAFDARRHEKPAPPWTLPDLDGKQIRSSEFKGKVVVLDFWGSWCGPCRQELPIFQAMYERYKGRGVVFIGMNWERPAQGQDPKRIVRDYIERNKFTFPVILDHDHVATTAYGIEGFPTVFLIDKSGTIRYKNVGVAEGIETILQDQIESLMN